MAKPYSNDLRIRVATAIAEGESCRSIAERFEIAPSTVVKWTKRVRDTVAPRPPSSAAIARAASIRIAISSSSRSRRCRISPCTA